MADATVATPNRWSYSETPGGSRRPLSVLPQVVIEAYVAADRQCTLGLEIIDEALCTLCYRRDLWCGDAQYPDLSCDEDKAFVSALKQRGARFLRLGPGRPAFEHVKHGKSVVVGPATALHRSGLGWATQPPVALTAALVAYSAVVRLLVAIKHQLGS